LGVGCALRHQGRSRRGSGVTEHVLAEARARGFEVCTLWTLTDNERARRFYEAVGFGLDGATRTEAANTDHPLHEVRYRCSL
jgi:ribosomal protein S18 acetylase RimI-like enzyme